MQLGFIRSIDTGHIIKLDVQSGEVGTFGTGSSRVSSQALQGAFAHTQLMRNLDTGEFEDAAMGELPGWVTSAFLATWDESTC